VLLVVVELRAAGRAGHAVVMVWDGMRPDFVSEQTTPTLFKLAQEGVTFRRHHPVFVTATEVNGTALATGVYPDESGLIGNREFRPSIDAANRTAMENLEAIRKGDKLTGNHYLAYPTIAELLHAQGRRTAVAGTKAVAILQDRAARSENALGLELFEGRALPETLMEKLASRLGRFPKVSKTSPQADVWTTEALVGPLWEKEVPPFSVLWMSQPDYSQHATGPGSPSSLAAIRSADENLARVLAALEARHLRQETDVIVVSDHGFSTIERNTDVEQALKKHGFHAGRKFSKRGGRDGDIMVVGNGGAVFLYVIGHARNMIEKVTHFLQTQSFSGVVFTQIPVEGAFRLQDVHINSAGAPDIVLSMRWKPDKSTNGTPGLLCMDFGEFGPGQGTHGSLSPFDLHNTCVAAGPDFRKGFVDELPSGNIDIAPTVLWILGIEPKQKQSGRVLTEALAAPGANDQSIANTNSVKPHHLEAKYRSGDFQWRQYLNSSEFSGVFYFDEGNGEQLVK
jgi:predicted AlkP superfamily pyrophosphatase or phosphodiesterase